MNRRLLAALGAALLAACISKAPAPRYHSLLAAPGAAGPALAVQPWQLLPVGVPSQVDRPQWVVRTADDTLVVLEQERWIAPLADEIGAALADVLGRRLGPPSPQAARAWRVRVDVQRLESLPGRLARLEAVWALQPPEGAALAPCAVTLEQPVGAGYAALAAGHRQALAQLGERIASALAASGAGRPIACAPAA